MAEEVGSEGASNKEVWFNDWLRKASPLYQNSYVEFLNVSKSYDLDSNVELENTSSFYPTLLVTKELIKKSSESSLLSVVADDEGGIKEISEYLNALHSKLALVESKCTDINGEVYLAKEDVKYLVSLFLDQIRAIVNYIKELGIKYIDKFNAFLKEFSHSINVGLVDEEYVSLFEEELLKAEEGFEKYKEFTEKNKFDGYKRLAEAEVYVVCDKEDLNNYILKRWGQRLFLTSPGVNSLLESSYMDIKKLIKVFDVLAYEFYANYKYDAGLDSAISELKLMNSSFKPKLSASSKSNNTVFNTNYKGRKADFDRHICLGNSKNKERCFRLHFEWDEEDDLIVIHHAGNHLPMGSDK